MANHIKGLTVEIGDNTSGLEKPLSDVNNSIKKIRDIVTDEPRSNAHVP